MNILGFVGHMVSVQLLNSSIVAWNIPDLYEQAGLCFKKKLYLHEDGLDLANGLQFADLCIEAKKWMNEWINK